MTTPPTALNPDLSVQLRGQLAATVLAGNQDAAAILSLANGRPIPPTELLLAAQWLKWAQPARYDYALSQSTGLAEWEVGPVIPCMEAVQCVLRPLMLNAADLPWAARMLAASVAAVACPLAPELASAQALEDAWQLAPELLAYASQHCPPADLKRAWPETDPAPWKAAATAWLHTRDGAARQALIATRHYFDLDTPGETLHWLACDAVRRGQPTPEGSPRLAPPIPAPIVLRLPAPPGSLLGQLHALAQMGDPGATALARLCGGEVVFPHDQPLALKALTHLQPTIMRTTVLPPFSVDKEDPNFDLTPWMAIIEDALSPLVRDPADLPWAARILAAWLVPTDARDTDMKALELMWDLSASILAYVRDSGRADDLQRPWQEVDGAEWRRMSFVWPPSNTRGLERGLVYIINHLALSQVSECVHWLACEGLRQERYAFQ